MKALLQKKVRIFGRGIALGWVAVILATITAAAWAAVIIFYGHSLISATIAPAPLQVNVTGSSPQCVIVSGAGSAGAPTWDAATLTLSCAFSGLDDTTEALASVILNNNAAETAAVTIIKPPTTPCFMYEATPGNGTFIVSGGNQLVRTVLHGVAGESGTMSCGGQTLPLDFQLKLEPQVP